MATPEPSPAEFCVLATRSSCCRAGSVLVIAAIETADGPVAGAFPTMSVVVRLADQLDAACGDMFCSPGDLPHVADHVAA